MKVHGLGSERGYGAVSIRIEPGSNSNLSPLHHTPYYPRQRIKQLMIAKTATVDYY